MTSQVLVNDVLENDEAMMAIFKWFVKQFFENISLKLSGLTHWACETQNLSSNSVEHFVKRY